MTAYILDTDILTLFEDGHAAVLQHVRAHAPHELAITVLTVEEQLSGCYTELRQARCPERLAWAYRGLASTVLFLSRLQSVDYTEIAMRRFEQLRKQKVKIGKMDLRIAATVLEQGAILVTRNTRDFKQVPSLSLEDWSR